MQFYVANTRARTILNRHANSRGALPHKRLWLVMPLFKDLEELNQWREDRCTALWPETASRKFPGFVADAWEAEKPVLMALLSRRCDGRPRCGHPLRARNLEPIELEDRGQTGVRTCVSYSSNTLLSCNTLTLDLWAVLDPLRRSSPRGFPFLHGVFQRG